MGGQPAGAGGNGERHAPNAQILASGVALRSALHAQELLAQDWGVSAAVWSATSWTEFRGEAMPATSGTC